MGLHGRVKDGDIVQLGIITYNTELEECLNIKSSNDAEPVDTASQDDQKNQVVITVDTDDVDIEPEIM